MFDDHQPAAGGQVPSNLPIAEPEDIFGVTEAEASAGFPQPSSDPSEPPSALEAGVLRPAAPSQEEWVEPDEPRAQPPTMMRPEAMTSPTPHMMTSPPGVYAIKEPVLSRGVMTIIISIVVLLILAGGGWWIWSFIRGQKPTPVPTPQLPTTQQNTTQNGQLPEQPAVPQQPTTPATAPTTSGNQIDSQILFGEPLDRDSDGLDDARERDLGLNPENWDTDGDQLSDGDEVIIWKSDPLNRDTDGDTYSDGAEVKAGYSPTGPGRIFEPPTTTP